LQSRLFCPLVNKVWDPHAFIELRAGEEPNKARLAGIEDAQLRERALRFVVLRGSELFGANLTGAQLQFADLVQAQLQGTIFSGANLSTADLGGADLRSADLHKPTYNEGEKGTKFPAEFDPNAAGMEREE
jgi:uncharacterized protein YjbI with pentapeptide repeats